MEGDAAVKEATKESDSVGVALEWVASADAVRVMLHVPLDIVVSTVRDGDSLDLVSESDGV